MNWISFLFLVVSVAYSVSSLHTFQRKTKISLPHEIFDLLDDGSTLDAAGYINKILSELQPGVDNIGDENDLDLNEVSTLTYNQTNYDLNVTLHYAGESSVLQIFNNNVTYEFVNNHLYVVAIIQVPDVKYNVELELSGEEDTITLGGTCELDQPLMSTNYTFDEDEDGDYQLEFIISSTAYLGDGTPVVDIDADNIEDDLRSLIEDSLKDTIDIAYFNFFFALSGVLDIYGKNVTVSDFINENI